MSKNAGAKTLVAVMVTYNRLEKLKENLTRLLSNTEQTLHQVVVVDNASSDGTLKWLSGIDDPRLHILSSTENLGGAGGFDFGMRSAVSKFDPDWIVVMDDDASPASGGLEEFWAQERPSMIAVAAAVYFPNGDICEMNRPSLNPFWDFRTFVRSLTNGRDGYHIPTQAYDADASRPIDLTSFVGLFISREMIQKVGYPDPDLFLYGDDVLFTLRMRRSGFKIVFDPKVKFTHDCSTFSDDQNRTFSPLWKVYYAYRNGLIMYREAAHFLFWFLLPLLIVKWALAARRYDDRKSVYRRLMWYAIKDGITLNLGRSHQRVLDIASSK